MKFTSLRQKLILRNTIILVAAIFVVAIIFITFSFQQNQRQINNIRENHLEALIERGTALVSDKRISLKVHIEDNSFTTMGEIVRTNYQDDDAIVYAGFVAADYRPWVWVTPDDKEGEKLTNKLLENETTRWAMRLTEFQHRNFASPDNPGEEIYEFAAPIIIEPFQDGEEELGGAIIYGMSTAALNESIAAEQQEHRKNLINTLILLSALITFTLFFGFVMTQRQAGAITRPLAILSTAADTIAAGNYNVEVEVSSGDEIETLAHSFNQMARDLDNTYADLHFKNRELEEAKTQLEELNRDLERKVDERTRDLADSELKFRTLFEKSADAILLGNEQEFLDCNPSLLRMIGCQTKEEFLSLSPYEISPEEQPDGTNSSERLHDIYRRAIEQGSQHIEWVNKRIGGEVFNTEIVITSFKLGSRTVLHNVFRDITDRKRTEAKLKEAQEKLLETAHSAGMAEIATGVLHNIGNILNSVNISTEELNLILKDSKVRGFLKANDMVKKNMDTLDSFFTEHPKGKLIPGYYISLGEAIREEHHQMQSEITALINKVNMMRDVISTQQNYAKASLYIEDVTITDIIEDAIKLQIASLNKQGVEIDRQYKDAPKGMVPKVKLVHVLTNLIKNGKEAMAGNPDDRPQKLTISIVQTDELHAEIRIFDTGCGIAVENLDKIFNHGFTTKATGHGFGLHTCANFMTEMGGSLHAESQGAGKGSVFVVNVPLVNKDMRG